MYLEGQEEIKKLIDNGKLDNSNFIIIKGPRSYGKTYLTKYIALHYGMNYIMLDNKVETIRNLVDSSRNNNNCLYHFKDFEKSSAAAKAALLKIAEETPKGIKIVVTTSAYNLLNTLISRAYLLNIEPYTKDNIISFNNVLQLDNNLLSKIMDELNMVPTPSLLYTYKQREDLNEILDLTIETKNAISNGLRLEDISRISNKFWKDDREKLEIYLHLLKTSINPTTPYYYVVISAIERTLYNLNTIAISNYRQLIHNMLMEMIV